MKYMESGEFKNQFLMKLTITFSLFFLLLLWATNFILFFSKMGVTKKAVVDYYLGSAEEFSSPRSFAAMVEVTHFHLPIMAIVILFITHLLIFVSFNKKVKIFFISAAFIFALFNEFSGYLVRFINPNFAYLKIFSFIGFQIIIFLLITILICFLWVNLMFKKNNNL